MQQGQIIRDRTRVAEFKEMSMSIRRELRMLGLPHTQDALAEMLGCTRAVVSHLERGNTLPNGDVCFRISHIHKTLTEGKMPLAKKRGRPPKEVEQVNKTERKPRTGRGTVGFYVEFSRLADIGNGPSMTPAQWLGKLLMLCFEEGIPDRDTLVLLGEVAELSED